LNALATIPATGAPRVSGGIDPSLIHMALRQPLLTALEALGVREVAAIEADLSVPVGRDAAGNVNARSAPGQPPRTDEGILKGNVTHSLDAGSLSELPSLTISAARPPEGDGDDPDAAVILEFGGVGNWGYVQARPFMRPALNRLEGYAGDFVAAAVGQTL
jgi:hypothetical protein